MYINNMSDKSKDYLINNYLHITQYNKICEFWKIMEKLKYDLDNFENTLYWDYEDSDEEEIENKCMHNYELMINYKNTQQTKIEYYEKIYNNYVNKIGYELNDQSQDEILFNLLNNGILIDL